MRLCVEKCDVLGWTLSNDEHKILNIERKYKCPSYFKEEAGFNDEDYSGKLSTMFQQITNIGALLQPEEEVFYLINGIKSSNN